MGVVKMPSMSDKLRSLPVLAASEGDVMMDIDYIRKSCALVTDALKKGCDVLQMPDGEIVITEIRTVSFQYCWNPSKRRFEKVKSGSRLRKHRNRQKSQQWLKSNQTQVVAEGRTPVKASQVGEKQQPVLAKKKVLEESMA